jgi:hypothetical protein
MLNLTQPLRVLQVTLPSWAGLKPMYEILPPPGRSGCRPDQNIADPSGELEPADELNGIQVRRVLPRPGETTTTPGISSVFQQHRWDRVHRRSIPCPRLAMAASLTGEPALPGDSCRGHLRVRNSVRSLHGGSSAPCSSRRSA